MVAAYRSIEKFESLDGSLSYTFPLSRGEQQLEQNWRTPNSQGVGANYVYDHLGVGVSPKDVRRISIRALMKQPTASDLEAEVDDAGAKCHRIGLGYLYMLMSDGVTRRRCLARSVSAPSITYSGINFKTKTMPVIWSFLGESDWFSDTATTDSDTVTDGLATFTLNNAGNIPVLSGISFTLTALAAEGFRNVLIRNATNNSEVRWSGCGDIAGSVLQIGNPDNAVFYSSNFPSLVTGMTGRYVGKAATGPAVSRNAFSKVTLGRYGFPYLEVGNNTFYVQSDGSPNYTFAYSYRDAWS